MSMRVKMIVKDYGEDYRVSAKTLSSFYKREMNVRYRKPNYHISNIYTDAEMVKLQKDFVVECFEHMQKGAEVWFCDETSTHLCKELI